MEIWEILTIFDFLKKVYILSQYEHYIFFDLVI